MGRPLLLKSLTTAIAPINRKRATLTMSKKCVISHEFRIPHFLMIPPCSHFSGSRFLGSATVALDVWGTSDTIVQVSEV